MCKYITSSIRIHLSFKDPACMPLVTGLSHALYMTVSLMQRLAEGVSVNRTGAQTFEGMCSERHWRVYDEYKLRGERIHKRDFALA